MEEAQVLEPVQELRPELGFERRAGYSSDPYWSNFEALRTGPVNASTAQGVSAVYACVNAISETPDAHT